MKIYDPTTPVFNKTAWTLWQLRYFPDYTSELPWANKLLNM